MFFFFRAEDGIRDHCVTGVQTCALPIFLRGTPNEDQTYSVNPAEGRERLLEGMDLVIKALTEPQPFAWEGRYYQFRTVAVWPRPVQQPLPPMVVATRSDDMLHYAAEHKLGLAVSFVPVGQCAGGRGWHCPRPKFHGRA